MKLTIQMDCPAAQLLKELEYPGITQESVAITYAFVIAQEERTADWAAINDAIRTKWKGKTALERIRKMAWKHVERWQTGSGRLMAKAIEELRMNKELGL